MMDWADGAIGRVCSEFCSWNAYDFFNNIKLEDLAKPTGLTVDEYIRMMTTPDLERASAWPGKVAIAKP